jgi:hypothetical protein
VQAERAKRADAEALWGRERAALALQVSRAEADVALVRRWVPRVWTEVGSDQRDLLPPPSPPLPIPIPVLRGVIVQRRVVVLFCSGAASCALVQRVRACKVWAC